MCKKAKLQARIKPTAFCSAIDKENSIEFLLDFLHYLYNYYMVCALLSHTYHVTHHVMWHLWYNTFLHFLLCNKSKIKEKEKINIDNNLVILPSHDKVTFCNIINISQAIEQISK